ncbi:MAG: HIT family protein [Syntrophobacteraceae bacterium]
MEQSDANKEAVRDNPPGCCLFCSHEMKGRTFLEYGSVFAIRDNFPVSEGHFLVIPRRHTADFFGMTREERSDAGELLAILRERLASEDPSITGFNVGANCGVAAGQSVMHAHIHLIPRRDGDVPDPKGGVRGVIPRKAKY